MRFAVLCLLMLTTFSSLFAEEAGTLPPPPPEQFGYPGNIGPSRGWYVWHKYDPTTGLVDISRDPPGEHWTAKVIPWCTTYRLLSYGASPTELLPGERVNVFFNPDGKTKWGYVVHFQDEICQMRGHNHAWQVREVEPGDRWFRASLWMGNEEKLADEEWSFWIDVDCEKWKDGKRVETFPLQTKDHVWMTWVWQNGQRVVKRITDAASCETLKVQQEKRTKWRVAEEGLPGVLKKVAGAGSTLMLYSNGWSQARQFKPNQQVELILTSERWRLDARGNTFPATIETVKFGGTYGSGPIDIKLTNWLGGDAYRLLDQPKEEPASLRVKWIDDAQMARGALSYAANATASLENPDRLKFSSLEPIQSRLLAIKDETLRKKLVGMLPEIEKAAARYSRVRTLRDDARLHGGTIETAPGGPEWLTDDFGSRATEIYDRVTVVDLFDKKIAPKSGQKTVAIDDAWIERLKNLPDVEYLELQSTGVTDAGMKTVGTLKALKRLSITLLPVTGDGIKELAGLTELKRLSVASTKCTGEGFAALQPLTKLENLNFHSCLVNDAGLAEVGTLTSLERLEIVHTKFTDAGAKHLAGLKNLKRLQIGSREATGAAIAPLKEIPLREVDLHDGQASNEGLKHLSDMKSLRVLRVYGPVDNEGIASLAGLTNLETLVLSHTKLTDEGLNSLHGLKRLTSLDLTGCPVTAEAVQQLKTVVPGVTIVGAPKPAAP